MNLVLRFGFNFLNRGANVKIIDILQLNKEKEIDKFFLSCYYVHAYRLYVLSKVTYGTRRHYIRLRHYVIVVTELVCFLNQGYSC